MGTAHHPRDDVVHAVCALTTTQPADAPVPGQDAPAYVLPARDPEAHQVSSYAGGGSRAHAPRCREGVRAVWRSPYARSPMSTAPVSSNRIAHRARPCGPDGGSCGIGWGCGASPLGTGSRRSPCQRRVVCRVDPLTGAAGWSILAPRATIFAAETPDPFRGLMLFRRGWSHTKYPNCKGLIPQLLRSRRFPLPLAPLPRPSRRRWPANRRFSSAYSVRCSVPCPSRRAHSSRA